MDKQLKDKLTEASQIYGDLTILRVGINAIPFLDNSLEI